MFGPGTRRRQRFHRQSPSTEVREESKSIPRYNKPVKKGDKIKGDAKKAPQEKKK